jgi:hypothetical protein
MIERTTWFQLQPLYKHLRQQAENKKFYKYLEIGATFSLIAVFLFTAIAPTASAISKLIGDIKSKQLLEQKLKNKISSIILAQNNYSLMQENSKYQVLESSFPSRPRYYESALTFSSASKESSHLLNDLSFDFSDQKSSNTKNQNQLFGVISLTTGEYRSSLDIIKKIATNRRLIKFESVDLSQVDKKNKVASNSAYINLSLSSKLFYLPTISNGQK